MCNPPFFKDREERYGGGATHSELRPPPGTFSSGTLGETVTAGGEVEFVKRIIRDSLTLRKRVRYIMCELILLSIYGLNILCVP